jgi:hypothetical protein
LDRFKIGCHRLSNGEHSLAVVIADPVEAEADQLQRAAIGECSTERFFHRVGEKEQPLIAFAVSNASAYFSGLLWASPTHRRPEKRITLFT